jgi:hypothetical protein
MNEERLPRKNLEWVRLEEEREELEFHGGRSNIWNEGEGN